MTTTRPLLLALSTAFAATAPPALAWQDTVTTLPPGPHLHAPPAHLSFQVSWDGKINSAKVDFLWRKPDPRYPQFHLAQLYGGSTGPAKALFPYQYNFTSFVRKSDYRPVIFVAEEEDRDEKRVTTNRFGRTTRSKEVTDPHRRGKSTKTKTGTFTFARAPVYDLLSAFLYIRSLELKVHQEIVMVLHPFAGPYLARIKVEGREVHRGLNCLRMSLQLRKIGPTGKLLSYDKMKTATMWLSDDRERLPIELRTEVFIGDVRAILVGKKYL